MENASLEPSPSGGTRRRDCKPKWRVYCCSPTTTRQSGRPPRSSPVCSRFPVLPRWSIAFSRDSEGRAVDPTRRAIRLVDAQGRPVEGALASTYFQRDIDREPSFIVPEPLEAATSNARGLLALKLEIPGHLDGAGIYAIRQRKGRPLVGLLKVTREELDKPITITMHPACLVLFQIESTGLPALETKYHAELTGPGWWRAAYIVLGAGIEGTPRPLFASSTNGELEFLLPPGRVTLHAYGSDVKWVERPIDVKPDDRELVLGTLDPSPRPWDAENGRFPDHHRVRQNRARGDDQIVFRRIRYLPLRGLAREAGDVAFSPDGKFLATACMPTTSTLAR